MNLLFRVRAFRAKLINNGCVLFNYQFNYALIVNALQELCKSFAIGILKIFYLRNLIAFATDGEVEYKIINRYY